MPKKRKLNSKNPKWNKDLRETIKYKRVLKKENAKFKLYFLYEINE